LLCEDKLRDSKHIIDLNQSRNTKSQRQHVSETSHVPGDTDSGISRSDHCSNGAAELATMQKNACDEKLSKQDAADVVISQLTPYYKSRRFQSKVYFMSAARCSKKFKTILGIFYDVRRS